MPRETCKRCQFLPQFCVCHVIEPFDNHIEVLVLQHPNEAKHFKNSIKISQLTFKRLRVFNSQTQMNELRMEIEKPGTVMLFPNGQPVEQFQPSKTPIQRILVLDGTWKKAKRMIFEHSWLEQLPTLSIDTKVENQYQIRKSPTANHLSSHEAISHILSTLEHHPVSQFLAPFNTFQQLYMAQLPKEAQSRYK